MNKVILMGRLTRDPDVRYGGSEANKAVARYTLAVDRRGRQEEGLQTADFINCVAFGKSGEWAEKYLKRGTKITISGRIQTGSYTDRDGRKVYTTDVIVEDQEFAESKNAQEERPAPAPKQTGTPYTPDPVTEVDEWMQVPDEDGLPFK